ncbi:MAG: Fe-S cluster assembly protein SufD [Myxococcota bacterium]
MSELDAARDRHLALLAELAPAGDPAWLARLRADAKQAFADAGFPSTKQEEWRYTNLTPLAKLELARGSASPDVPSRAQVDSLARLCREDPGALEGRLGTLATPKQNPFADLNTAFLDDGAVVTVGRGVRVEDPIRIGFAARAGEAAHPRVLVVAEDGSRAQVVLEHGASGAAGFTNAVVEIHVGANASVDLVTIQREPEGHFHVSNLAVRQERDSRVGLHTLSLGGAWTRNDAAVALAGEGAECTLNGLFVGGGAQLVDNHTLVDHAVPHCTSSELYKGVLGASSRGVFRGRVIVRPDAQHTRAQQSNPNLLDGRGAEVDTKPQLEIYADDVKCSHGSTIGQLSGDALFYLRARGIAGDDARDMLTRAFAAEILAALPVDGLAEALDPLLGAALRRARGDAS